MKYVDDFRNGELARQIAKRIHAAVEPGRRYRLMEFCGGHTHAIARYGLSALLPSSIELIHGPGCPVCVLPIGRIDSAIELALEQHVTLCTYGDTLRVPASRQMSLYKARAAGADVRVVYSSADALALARAMPGRQVVFFGIGFETTTPPTAVALLAAQAEQLDNFSVFCNHVLTPAAMRHLLADDEVNAGASAEAGDEANNGANAGANSRINDGANAGTADKANDRASAGINSGGNDKASVGFNSGSNDKANAGINVKVSDKTSIGINSEGNDKANVGTNAKVSDKTSAGINSEGNDKASAETNVKVSDKANAGTSGKVSNKTSAEASGKACLDGFIGPSHVSTIIGAAPYREIARDYRKPVVITGFEPLDVLQAVLMLVVQINEGRAQTENQFTRAVTEHGNQKAQALVARVFELRHAFEWRGLGLVPDSALAIRAPFAQWDAEKRFNLSSQPVADVKACQCGQILRGRCKPTDCKVFGTACTPATPLGACMVSSEGACAAHYQYARFDDRAANAMDAIATAQVATAKSHTLVK